MVAAGRSRAGFTVVEVVIAILIVTVGLTAIAAATGAMTRMLNRGEMAADAGSAANDIFEEMRNQPCATLAAGNRTIGPYQMQWTVSQSPIGTGQRVSLISSYTFGRTARVDTFETGITCI